MEEGEESSQESKLVIDVEFVNIKKENVQEIKKEIKEECNDFVDERKEMNTLEVPVKVEIKVEAQMDNTQHDAETLNSQPNTSKDVQMEDIKEKVYENGRKNRVNCPICDKDFKNRANLKNHLQYTHASEDSAAECKYCYRLFKSKSHMRTHINSVHLDSKEVACELCEKSFINQKKLKNHMYYAHPGGGSVTCEICQKTYKSVLNLRIHKRQVHPPEEKSTKCDFCDKTFKNFMLLQRHIKWSHPDDGMIYRCSDCDRVLPSLVCYRKHIQNVHSSTQVECHVCSRVFKNKNILERHLRTVNCRLGRKPRIYKIGDVQCSECDKMLFNQTAGDVLRPSTNKKENVCEVCFKQLDNIESVKEHIQRDHSIHMATCSVCQKQFTTHLSLQRHLRVTHASPEDTVSCDHCKRMFKHLLHLRVHINAVHSQPDTTFPCEICNKQFSSKKYLRKHKITHIKTRSEHCDICFKSFKHISEVTKHKKRIHGKKPIPATHTEVNESMDKVSPMPVEVDLKETENQLMIDCNLIKIEIE